MTQLKHVSAELLRALQQQNLRLAIAESCTGGLICHSITQHPGASDVLNAGFVTYSNASKTRLLGVPEQLINKEGAVSEAVALSMAQGAFDQTNASIAVASTGIAGPGGASAEKPVGTVYLALKTAHQHVAVLKHFSGNRNAISEQASLAALELCLNAIT